MTESKTKSNANSNTSPIKRTSLFQCHVDAGGKVVDFSGWEMPVSYGSQIEEHHAVRTASGMFDVSHMTILDVTGSGGKGFLSRLLANNIDKANTAGKAIYTCMLDESGGIVDDLIAYYMSDEHYQLIVNAGTREKDIAWITKHLPEDVSLQERKDLALVAVQGPEAQDKLLSVLPATMGDQLSGLKRFSAVAVDGWFIARTGYTGEDGFEIALPEEQAPQFWNSLIDAEVRPCGLGARDTLRLEAGMNLYGSDMSEAVSPLECGLEWTIGWKPTERDFIGRSALEKQKASANHQVFVGLVLEGRGVLRGHQKIYQGDREVGEVTSGTYSPTLEKSIAFARVDAGLHGQCDVLIRDKKVPATFVTLPFVKNATLAYKTI